MEINPGITIEELVEKFPAAVTILRNHNLVCVICGEPVWGTLDDLARSKGLGEHEIMLIIEEITETLSAGRNPH